MMYMGICYSSSCHLMNWVVEPSLSSCKNFWTRPWGPLKKRDHESREDRQQIEQCKLCNQTSLFSPTSSSLELHFLFLAVSWLCRSLLPDHLISPLLSPLALFWPPLFPHLGSASPTSLPQLFSTYPSSLSKKKKKRFYKVVILSLSSAILVCSSCQNMGLFEYLEDNYQEVANGIREREVISVDIRCLGDDNIKNLMWLTRRGPEEIF